MKALTLDDRTKKIIAICICVILVLISVYALTMTRYRIVTEEVQEGREVYEITSLKDFSNWAPDYFPFMAFFLPIIASVLLSVYILKIRIPIDIKLEYFLIAALVCVFFSDLVTRIHHNEYLEDWAKSRSEHQELFSKNNIHTLLVLICVPIMSFGIFKKWRPLVTIPAIIVVFMYINRMNEVYSYHSEYVETISTWLIPLFPAASAYRNPRPYVWEILFFATVAVVSFMRMPSLKLQYEATPKQRLAFLKEQFEAGNITEEEYAEKRAEILSKL